MYRIFLDIHAGEGGDDSKLFCEDLFGLYAKWATLNGLTIDKAHASFGHIICEISADKDPRPFFLREIGKHCVQRVPPTETASKRHTSIVSVVLIEVREKKVHFNVKDCNITVQRGHGKGGQNQNKVESAVRAVHRPTGIAVFINGRDQRRNKDTALDILSERVEKHYADIEQTKTEQATREQRENMSRGSKIRTYNFVEHRVVDHVCGVKLREIERFFKKGDLSVFYT